MVTDLWATDLWIASTQIAVAFGTTLLAGITALLVKRTKNLGTAQPVLILSDARRRRHLYLDCKGNPQGGGLSSLYGRGEHPRQRRKGA